MKTDFLGDVERIATDIRLRLEASDADLLPIGLQEFPYGSCLDASLLLAHHFQCCNSIVGEWRVVNGWSSARQSHAWLEFDGMILDITADQFDRMLPPVWLTRDFRWHSRFEQQRREPAVLDNFEELGGELSRLYNTFHFGDEVER